MTDTDRDLCQNRLKSSDCLESKPNPGGWENGIKITLLLMCRVLPPSRLSWNIIVAPSPKASLWSHSSLHPVLTVVLQEPSLTKTYTAPSQVSNPSSLLSALNKLQKENVTHHCFSDDLLQVCNHSLLFCPFVPRVSPITYFSPSMGISAFILQLLQSNHSHLYLKYLQSFSKRVIRGFFNI